MPTELRPQATGTVPGTGPSPDGSPEGAVYFIADAHLGAESQSLESDELRDLLGLLLHLQGCASFLYLVGDLFDFWFGTGETAMPSLFRQLFNRWRLIHRAKKAVRCSERRRQKNLQRRQESCWQSPRTNISG